MRCDAAEEEATPAERLEYGLAPWVAFLVLGLLVLARARPRPASG